METMDIVADFLHDLPRDFPLTFDIVHYTLCVIGEKVDIGNSLERVATKHPLACWMSSMLTCFAGGILVALMCGEAVLPQLTSDPKRLAIATVIWYILFYGPQKPVETLVGNKTVKSVLCAIKGLYYPHKIASALRHAKHVLRRPDPISLILIATVKANGSGVIKPFARLVRAQWIPEATEVMRPSLTTKYCLLCSILYVLYPSDLTYIFISGLLVAMRLGPLFDFNMDPFSKIESTVSQVVFGRFKAE